MDKIVVGGKNDLVAVSSSIFSELGSLLEATIKPHLAMYLSLINIANKKESDFSEIRSQTLGTIIYNIQNDLKYKNRNVYRTLLFKIKLNDLRNICKHDEYEVNGSEITCRYGKKLEKEIVMSKDELIEIFMEVYKKLVSMRVALTIFVTSKLDSYFIQNKNSYINLNEKNEELETRTIDIVFYFCVFLLSEGYSIIDIKEDGGNGLNIEVNDLTKNDIKWRTAYLLTYCFKYFLDLSTRFNNIKLVYKDKKDNPYVSFMFNCGERDSIKEYTDFIKSVVIEKYC